jgi:Family of unknown function (DUF6459)
VNLARNYERIRFNRALRAPAIEKMLGWQYQPDTELPDPDELLQRVALGAVECLAGLREPEQLEPWLSPDAFERICGWSAPAARRRTPGQALGAFQLLACRRMGVDEGVVEAVGVVSTGLRVRAVAVRAEYADWRWRVTELRVL